MNRSRPILPLLALAALAVLSTATASAQQRYDPAIPRGVSEQRVEPSGELAQPARAPIPPRLVQNARRTQHDADARACLTLATNKAVHRCSLKYRSRASRAAVVKASTKRSSAQPAASAGSADIAKPAEVVKPGAPRPGDAAKAQELVKPMDVTKPGGTPKTIDSTAKAPEAAKPPVPAPSATPPAKAPAPAARAPEPAKK